jgi:flagellar basal body-associated protein FliL
MLLILLGMPQWGRACAVCFGAPDDPQTKGVQAAIIVLLVITYLILLSIFGLFFYLFRRRARAVVEPQESTS